MNTARDDDFDVQEAGHEEYEYMTHEEVMRLSERIMEQHKEALIALANA